MTISKRKQLPSPINRNGGRALFMFAAFSGVFVSGNALATLGSALVAEDPASRYEASKSPAEPTAPSGTLNPEVVQLEAETSKFETCDARNAGKKAREMGVAETRVVLNDGERFVVTGRKNGRRARISFLNEPHCPVSTAIGL